jgi:hydrogenase expression/formation protein HypC
MCLAIPAKITHISPDGDIAEVALGGVSKEISLALISDASVGDYVLVHVGYALNKVSEEEAEHTLELIREIGLLMEDEMEAADEQDGAVPGAVQP